MPLFDFHCRKCGADFEELVAASGDTVACPDCGSRRVQRRPSAFAVTGEARQAGGNAGCSGCSRCSARAGGRGCAGCGHH